MAVDRLEHALLFAKRLHATQVRKCSNTPYFSHLMMVSAMVMENGGSEDAVIAALFHDALEDQGASYPSAFTMTGPEHLRAVIARDFGQGVLDLVEALTETDEDPKPPWKERKEKYLAHLKGASKDVALIALADKIHNARTTLADIRTKGAVETWAKFNGDMESQKWWYTSLLNIFTAHKDIPESLLWELDEIVFTMFCPEYEDYRPGE